MPNEMKRRHVRHATVAPWGNGTRWSAAYNIFDYQRDVGYGGERDTKWRSVLQTTRHPQTGTDTTVVEDVDARSLAMSIVLVPSQSLDTGSEFAVGFRELLASYRVDRVSEEYIKKISDNSCS